MNKIELSKYKNLVDECISLLSERRFDLAVRDLEWRHELGELIDNSEIYKNSENKTDFVKKLAGDIGISYPLLYQCLEFYRKYPNLESFIQLYNSGKKSIKWSEVRLLLVENPSSCPHDEVSTEKIVITREKCSKCSKTLKEDKQKL